MYQANGDPNRDRQIVDFTKFFNSSVLSLREFKQRVRYTKWNYKLPPPAVGIKPEFIRIRISQRGIQVFMSPDVRSDKINI